MRSTTATIDLDALAWNVNKIQHRVGGSGIIAMIKGNAYGHGIVPIARALTQMSVEMIGVAYVDEASVLRAAGIELPIIVVTPSSEQDAQDIIDLDLVVVLGSIDQALHLAAEAVKSGREVECHLFVDTGMHRDGVMEHDVLSTLDVVSKTKGIRVTGICTHFATADELGSPFLKEQIDHFDRVIASCRENGHSFDHVHAANTGAIVQAPSASYTLVRPGLALYGYAAPDDPDLDLRPVMSVTTMVLATRRLGPGETVSYGQRYTVEKETTIITLPIGYGDGYLRASSGRGNCIINGKEYPIVGTISMDSCMVDVGDDEVGIGDEVVMLGSDIDAWRIADCASTIPYEILTSVSERVQRRYIGSLAAVATNEVDRKRV